MRHADSLNAEILPYGQQALVSIEPVLKAFDETYVCVNKLMKKNIGNNPVLKFLKDIRTEMQSLVPINFPEFYTFERMKDLPRYCKALALRAQRGSLNLVAAQKKIQEVLVYSRQLQQMLNGRNTPLPSLDGRGRMDNDYSNPKVVQPSLFDLAVSKHNQSSPKDSTDPNGIEKIIRFKDDISVDYPEDKKMMIEELFWMIEEYKVSLFAQELKTPYPVSPKKLNQLIDKIEKL